MTRISKIINVPKILKSDEKSKEILMEFIDGKKLSEHLDSFSLSEQKKIARKIGESVAKLHDANIIHGDLTTSNMILGLASLEKEATPRRCKTPKGVPRKISGKDFYKGQIFFIDFGLSFHSEKIEDRAVDLYLLKQAFEAKHFLNSKILFREFLKSYKSKNKEKVLEQLEKVEKRRRYK
jgi:TP53 regulating kinase-like protein